MNDRLYYIKGSRLMRTIVTVSETVIIVVDCRGGTITNEHILSTDEGDFVYEPCSCTFYFIKDEGQPLYTPQLIDDDNQSNCYQSFDEGTIPHYLKIRVDCGWGSRGKWCLPSASHGDDNVSVRKPNYVIDYPATASVTDGVASIADNNNVLQYNMSTRSFTYLSLH